MNSAARPFVVGVRCTSQATGEHAPSSDHANAPSQSAAHRIRSACSHSSSSASSTIRADRAAPDQPDLSSAASSFMAARIRAAGSTGSSVAGRVADPLVSNIRSTVLAGCDNNLRKHEDRSPDVAVTPGPYLPGMDDQRVSGEPIDLLSEAVARFEYAQGRDGMVHLELRLEPRLGDPLLRALMRIEAELLLEDADRFGNPDEEPRTHAQRGADALVLLTERMANARTQS